jgi:ComEC/Rec2-related protein
VLALEDPEPGAALWLTRLRLAIAEGIRARLPGETGGFVAAILTGDRSGVGRETTEALRQSNLAHLLAISGLHMGLLTAVVYGALRAAMALFPLLALHLPIRKLAAGGALAAATFYLMLSGGNVATQRAFVMAAVMLGAILLDRRALSLRSVALAAILILLWRPEALLSPGFQMSFAATVALVAVFQTLRKRRARMMAARRPWAERRRLPGWLTGLGGIALCSLVAGLATAPVAAAHFHRMAEYGLLANLLSMPLMGTVVMPGAVIAAALWPVGLRRTVPAISRSSSPWPGSNRMRWTTRARCVISTTTRVAHRPAVGVGHHRALFGLQHVDAHQRRLGQKRAAPAAGPEGAIAVSASTSAPMGRIGPVRRVVVGRRSRGRRHQRAVADQLSIRTLPSTEMLSRAACGPGRSSDTSLIASAGARRPSGCPPASPAGSAPPPRPRPTVRAGPSSS